MTRHNHLENPLLQHVRFHNPELMGGAPFRKYSFTHGRQKVHVTLKKPLTSEQKLAVEAHKKAHAANDAGQIQITDALLVRKLQRHTDKWLIPDPWFT